MGCDRASYRKLPIPEWIVIRYLHRLTWLALAVVAAPAPASEWDRTVVDTAGVGIAQHVAIDDATYFLADPGDGTHVLTRIDPDGAVRRHGDRALHGMRPRDARLRVDDADAAGAFPHAHGLARAGKNRWLRELSAPVRPRASTRPFDAAREWRPGAA
jgi:hypothetical protein